MIQEFGAEHAYDNHFEPHEPAEKDYLLHFTSAGCLSRVCHVGGTDADAGDSGEVVELPRLADYPRRPARATYLFSLGDERFFLALDDRVSAPAGFAYESVNWLRHAEPQHLLLPHSSTAGIATTASAGAAARRPSLGPEAARSSAPSAPGSSTPRSAPAPYARWCALPTTPPTTRSCSRATPGARRRSGRSSPASPRYTVRREVREEVGLSVKNPRFYKSQPWSFTDTLMAGFWCEVDGDTALTVDRSELKEARWFRRDEVPLERTGDRASLTGEMVGLLATLPEGLLLGKLLGGHVVDNVARLAPEDLAERLERGEAHAANVPVLDIGEIDR